ncbi:MAG TPA: hypothetical protein PLO23_05325, partial [Alphaproteobacteria bacterium]|nr:hypothetical protein [Alphaproteobacteria bacterium]
MTQKFFGTDGIRGRANAFPMTADIALKVAMAGAIALKRGRKGKQTNRAVIGKDTRLSCYILEQAITAGFLSMGIEEITDNEGARKSRIRVGRGIGSGKDKTG